MAWFRCSEPGTNILEATDGVNESAGEKTGNIANLT